MSDILDKVTKSEYKYGFTTDIESDKAPIGLNEDIIRFISAKKEEPQWLLDWRLKSFEVWKEMTEPKWANVTYPKPDFQAITYYSAPKKKKVLGKDVNMLHLLDILRVFIFLTKNVTKFDQFARIGALSVPRESSHRVLDSSELFGEQVWKQTVN